LLAVGSSAIDLAPAWLKEFAVSTFGGYLKYRHRLMDVRPDIPITGVAWMPTRGIYAEVRIDHGAWQPTELSTEVSVDTWRMFRLRGRWAPGVHGVEVRATDETGYTQIADRASRIPDGASG
jgi:hypothetical protein